MAGRWEAALGLLERMRGGAIPPGNYCYSRAMMACVRGGVPAKALPLLQAMRQQQADGKLPEGPDLASHGAYMAACGGAGRWEEVLQTLEHMQRQGPQPDALCYLQAVAALVACGRRQEAAALLLQQDRSMAASSASGGEGARLAAHHAVLLSALDAGDWQCFDALARHVQAGAAGGSSSSRMLVPNDHTRLILAEAARRRGAGGGGHGSGEGGQGLQEVRAALAHEVATNPHDPLRRAKMAVLGFSPQQYHRQQQAASGKAESRERGDR